MEYTTDWRGHGLPSRIEAAQNRVEEQLGTIRSSMYNTVLTYSPFRVYPEPVDDMIREAEAAVERESVLFDLPDEDSAAEDSALYREVWHLEDVSTWLSRQERRCRQAAERSQYTRDRGDDDATNTEEPAEPAASLFDEEYDDLWSTPAWYLRPLTTLSDAAEWTKDRARGAWDVAAWYTGEAVHGLRAAKSKTLGRSGRLAFAGGYAKMEKDAGLVTDKTAIHAGYTLPVGANTIYGTSPEMASVLSNLETGSMMTTGTDVPPWAFISAGVGAGLAYIGVSGIASIAALYANLEEQADRYAEAQDRIDREIDELMAAVDADIPSRSDLEAAGDVETADDEPDEEFDPLDLDAADDREPSKIYDRVVDAWMTERFSRYVKKQKRRGVDEVMLRADLFDVRTKWGVKQLRWPIARFGWWLSGANISQYRVEAIPRLDQNTGSGSRSITDIPKRVLKRFDNYHRQEVGDILHHGNPEHARESREKAKAVYYAFEDILEDHGIDVVHAREDDIDFEEHEGQGYIRFDE